VPNAVKTMGGLIVGSPFGFQKQKTAVLIFPAFTISLLIINKINYYYTFFFKALKYISFFIQGIFKDMERFARQHLFRIIAFEVKI